MVPDSQALRGRLVTGHAMKTTLANAEAAREEVPRGSDEFHSQELRKAIAEYIELQREALKALRRKLN